MAGENSASLLDKALSDHEIVIQGKLANWDKVMEDREEHLNALEEQELDLLNNKEIQCKRIQELQNNIDQLEREEIEELEKDGVLIKLEALNDKIEELKSQFWTENTILPECPVCLEICDPSQSRLVFCCPEGHSICGQCADKVSKCPTCNRQKSNFGGAFTRVREFERLSGEMVVYKDCMNYMERICELVVEKKPLEKLRQELEGKFDKKKNPLLNELKNTKSKVSAIEQELEKVKHEYETLENSQIYYEDVLVNTLSILNKFIDERCEAFNRSSHFFKCTCELKCPHILLIEKDGKIGGNLCYCVAAKPCLCVTHSITMDLFIEGGSSGSIEIHLAGRSNPRSVNRFFRAAKENHFADLTIDSVQKDSFLDGGYFTNDKRNRRFAFNLDEKVSDRCDKHLIECRDFSVGYEDDEDYKDDDFGRTSFCVYRKCPPIKYFRNVGMIVDGFEILEEINNLPVESISGFGHYPKQLVTIGRSTGCVVTKKLKLY